MQLQDICVIRVRLWVMPHALSVFVWTIAENCNWCNHYFVGLVHLLILLISLPPVLSFCVFSLFTCSCLFHFLAVRLSSYLPHFAKATFCRAHISLFFSVDAVCLLAKVCYKTVLTSSLRIFLSFRLNAVHRIQLEKIRQPAKRRKTKCVHKIEKERTNEHFYWKWNGERNHTHNSFSSRLATS